MLTTLIDEGLICLDIAANDKQGLFVELAARLKACGKIGNQDQFVRDLWARENLDNTGFEQGVALPHAKSEAVLQPAIVIGISRQGIDYGAEDGLASKLFFMIASPAGGANHHIEVLAELSTKLLEPGFIPRMQAATSKTEVLSLLAATVPVGVASKQPVRAEATAQPRVQAPEPQDRSIKAQLNTLKQHLLFGTSHMIPFIVAGGVLLSLSVMMSGKGAVPEAGVLKDMADMGIAGLTLFTAVLGGYIAYSMADKPGLAPGMIGSWIAVQQFHTGFLGAILVGFIAGLIVNQLKRIRLPDSMSSLGSIFIYPLIGTFLVCGIVMWVIGAPIAAMMEGMNHWLSGMAGSGKVMLGAILGGMTAFDMGGPINKVATLFAQTQVNTQPWLMGGVGIAICVPPLGMALATLLSPKRYKKEEREAGKAAAIMGMIGISEGAIPFAAADPVRVIPAIVAGGIVGNITGFMMHSINHAPWGGWIVLPVVEGKMGYILGTVLGALTTALIVNLLKKPVTEDETVTTADSGYQIIEAAGEADVLAITACPSGVAHTFLAAKSLQKAAAKAGIKLKVETQGANGIINRISAKDVANARCVILAHDVAIKNRERFANIEVIDVKTREAIHNPEGLLARTLAGSKVA
ncbi:PTS fructose transporter subunit EIIC [Aeromonas salmonicida]|uniref:protein-N(pi)-phosphohistidine--D-fructose phosphotransferase n=1 Tax=Aeromonas salmonicida TaxID=645 RepID=A0AAX1PF86_AERSA|nr:PTS fructose transporter subunit EIIC [Aeromonas salmonicida]RAJ01952.1 PTS system IIA component (Fru family) /PTS system IIB component (Fru family) /PTS system IIC component (Fru family) [Aeromonas salmonicida]